MEVVIIKHIMSKYVVRNWVSSSVYCIIKTFVQKHFTSESMEYLITSRLKNVETQYFNKSFCSVQSIIKSNNRFNEIPVGSYFTSWFDSVS